MCLHAAPSSHTYMPGLEHREIQINNWCVGENTVLHDGDRLAECIQGKMQRRGPLCQLRIENEVHEALLELEEGVGQAQLVDAQGLLGAIPGDEMPEEERQIRCRRPRNAHARKDVVGVDGVDEILQKPAVTGLVEVEQLHFTGGIEKILRIDVIVDEAILPR